MPQSLAQLYVSLVFGTQNREPFLRAPLRAQMHPYLATVLTNGGSPAIKVGGSSDHIHALFRLSKDRSLADIVEGSRRAPPNGSRRREGAWPHFIGKTAMRDSR
jgi:REP-associated tyrosine transposase